VAAGLLGLLALLICLFGEGGRRLGLWLLEARERLRTVRWVLVPVLLGMPLIIRYGISPGFYILSPNLRFIFLTLALLGAAYLLCAQPGRLVSRATLGLSAGVLVLVSAITNALLMVSSDPFSLSWSEGNRLYDYSLVFGQAVYDYSGRIPDPYNTPGRYGLWGILFLWPGLPIWAHRLWNVTLLTVPSLLLAWFLTRRILWRDIRIALFLWIAAFFIVLAPLHPPFMLAAIIVAAFAFTPSPGVRAASILVASLYVGISRWTWVLAPGAWGALTEVLVYYPGRKGGWFQRLLPAALLALLGVLPGFLLNVGNILGYSTGDSGTAQQPLLWFRLLPNATLGPGILLLALWTAGPLLVLLACLMWTRRWRMDPIQSLAVWGVLLAFFGAGILISTKIGGGGDLHNLDMFLMTLMFVTCLSLSSRYPSEAAMKADFTGAARSAWLAAMVCLMLLLPTLPFTPLSAEAGSHAWLDFPTSEESAKVLRIVRSRVEDASAAGEVLFMDQRQLLTFGYIQGVPFVPEYEKKYMMDQALASNAEYFRQYYRDLASGRFALIITEPLKTNLKGGEGGFADENDYWVKWVSIPTLCFYEPILTDRVVDVQLLVPRANPQNCLSDLESDPR
jgi:hypothetical protein